MVRGKQWHTHQASLILQQRLSKILDANPWLAGRIVQREDGMNVLEYDTTRRFPFISDKDD